MLGAIVEGVPAGLALTEDDLAVDLARRQRGYGRGARQAIEQDRARILSGVRHGRTLGSPILLEVDNRDWENWTRVMQVEPLTEERGRGARGARRRGQQARPADHPRPARARGPRRGAQVRLQRRAQRARALVGARDDGAGRGGRRRAGVPARARHRGLVVHRRGRRRRDRPGARRRGRATRRTPRPCAARTPTPRRAMIARIDEARSNGDTVGGVFEVVVHGAPIGLGSYVHWDRRLDAALAARRHEHQHRQGRRDRARVRADAPVRVAGPRRDRGPARRRDVDPPLEQRGRPDRRRHQRRADRRARRGEADLDARAAAADRRPRDRRAGREGALRAERHLASCPRRASSARRWSCSRSPGSCSRRRAATRWPRSLDNLRRAPGADRAAPIAAPAAGDGSGGHAAVRGGRRDAAGVEPDAGEAGSGGDD